MTTDFLRFFSYHQPRRIRVIENILKSRRTVANLFWAQQYGIIKYLGARRNLTRKEYDDGLHLLVVQELIAIDDNNQALLTEKGVAVQQEKAASQYEPFFYDWFWIANTYRVLERLLLAIQVVSKYSYHQSRYVPLQISYNEMQFVKQWFRHNYNRSIITNLYAELYQFGQAIASEDETLATDFFNMLVGHDISGWTIEQAGQHLKMTTADLQLMRHDELLAVAAYALKVPGLLQQLLGSLLNSTPLSRSAQITINRLQQGTNIKVIARQRHLKENTVREHLLEAAIMIPQRVNWEQLLPAATRTRLSKLYSGAPSTWHYQGDAHDNQGFFEYRLYQIYQGAAHEQTR